MRWITILSLATLFLLLPAPAFAWGPAAHLDFALELLRDLTLIAPAVAVLLRRFPNDFLYGAMAADIIVAKNLSPYHLHCHNWRVAFSILDRAEDDAARAFSWGYLGHLAADVVAHNYYVPLKMVEDFRRHGAPHMYWEVRFDNRIPQEVWSLARDLSRRDFHCHDRLLEGVLSGTLLPFRLNRRIFNGVVTVNRMMRWKRMAAANARRSPVALTEGEASELRAECLARMRDLMTDGMQSATARADPTGHCNLLLARDARRRLRGLARDSRLLPCIGGDGLRERFKPVFLAGTNGPVELPSLDEFVDPYAPAPPRRKARRFLIRLRRRLWKRLRKLRVEILE